MICSNFFHNFFLFLSYRYIFSLHSDSNAFFFLPFLLCVFFHVQKGEKKKKSDQSDDDFLIIFHSHSHTASQSI